MVGDNEATSIVCDNFLTSFSYDEVSQVLNIIASKMRLKSELVILQPDIRMLSQKVAREEIDERVINSVLFDKGPIKSVTSAESIQALIPNGFQVSERYFDISTFNIVIKARRVQ
tara:strand:+ start:691 stop:1035 length:345 start_codon:yes stop_codon:yes gene_type:complete